MLSFLVSLTLVPVALSYLPLSAARHREGLGLLRWTLQSTANLSIRQPRAIMVVALLLLAAALAGIPKLQNNTALVAFLHADAPLAIDTRYIDEHLSGVNALEFMLGKS